MPSTQPPATHIHTTWNWIWARAQKTKIGYVGKTQGRYHFIEWGTCTVYVCKR